jgi:O-antigen ligase
MNTTRTDEAATAADAEPATRWVHIADTIVGWAFCALLLTLPLAFYVEGPFKLFELAKLRVLYGAAAVIAGGWALGVAARRTFTVVRTPLDIPLLAYGLAIGISTALSANPAKAFWGHASTPAGSALPTLTCIGLYFAFVAHVRTREHLLRCLRWFVAGAALTAGWGVLQHYGFDWLNTDEMYRLARQSYGTFGNPAPQGWYVTLMLPIVAWLFITGTGPARLLLGMVWCVLVLGMLAAGSRSGLIGAMAGLGVFGMVLIAARRAPAMRGVARALLMLALAAVLATALFVTQRTAATALTSRVSVGSLRAGGFERFALWRDALTIWRQHPIFGCGPEAFADEHNLIRATDIYPNALRVFGHAHNEYLHVLATTGAVGLAAYVTVILVFLWQVIRRVWARGGLTPREAWLAGDVWPFALAGGVVSILASQLLNPHYLPTTLAFYVLLAATMSWMASASPARTIAIRLAIRPTMQVAAAIGIVGMTLVVLQQNARAWSAHLSYRRAVGALEQSQVIAARDLIDQAIALDRTDADFWWVRAQAYVALAGMMTQDGRDPDLIRTSQRIAIASSDRSVLLDPAREDLWRQRSICFRDLADLDPAQAPVATEAIRQAIARFPNNGLNYLFLARLEARNGRRDEALRALEACIARTPTSLIAYAELATIYYRQGNLEAAARAVKRFLALGPRRPHRNLVNRLHDEAASAGDTRSQLALGVYLRTMPRPRT